MADETVEYELDGRKVRFKIRKVKYGEWQKAMASAGAGAVEMFGNVSKSRIDTTKLMDELMKMSVSSEDKVDYHDLSMADGLDLQDRVLAANGMSGKEQPFRPA